MDNCIFCKIVRGEIPSFKIYEDEKTYAFLDIADDYEGHTLVIPKAHCVNVLDCSGEVMAAVMATVQKVSRHYVEDCGYEGVDLFNCSGEAAQQSVFHFHMHIIPRKSGDGIDMFPAKPKKGTDIEKLCEKLALKS